MQEFLTKAEEISRYGEYPGSRPIEKLVRNGLIILDKWSGPTSHNITSDIKKIFGLKKAAHAGTLDPAVTGVLPILLENAVKIMPALQKQDKEYVGIMKLHKDVEDEKLRDAIKKSVGSITQLPPVRSAVARKERMRKVYFFDIIEINGRDVLFKIGVEAGTYIRVICHQIGKEIGGAHMAELRRTCVGRFRENQAVKMQDVVDAFADWQESGDESIRNFILPVEAATEHIKKIIIKDSAVYSVSQGSPLYSQGISRIEKGIEIGELVAVMTLKGELVSLSTAAMTTEEAMKKRWIAAKTDRV
ncbi:MAG: RNA-guided pseudouridylation complex pseudouridine synthase subunit Cbf5, partial [Candidatus Aenigmarchaeota archaeon]|nr:RNA-guided pseudouridylation complex pseudouridine synthase subunit Cbf5 [Candidatus Aenigmarchaeota archaeon]